LLCFSFAAVRFPLFFFASRAAAADAGDAASLCPISPGRYAGWGRSGPAGLVDARAWGASDAAEKTLKSDAAGERRERGKARTDSGRMDG